MTNNYSSNLFSGTEKVGEQFDLDTHPIISDRYHFAGSLARGVNALEIGCGSGIGLEYLSSAAKSLDALEFSAENIDLLKTMDVGSTSILQGDAHLMPYESKRFDLVIGLAMIYYLSLTTFIRESSRVMRDEGILFFCTSNKDVPGFCEAPCTTKYHSIPELYAELDKGGFIAEFYGAFPKDNGPLILRVILGWIKDSAKLLFGVTGKGRKVWEKLRLKSLGVMIPLPTKLTQQNITSNERVILSPHQRNYQFRVIYVVARKKKDS